MDALRARMMREGYLLKELTPKERERVWYSLAQKRRRSQLAALLGVPEDALDALVTQVRKERAQSAKQRSRSTAASSAHSPTP